MRPLPWDYFIQEITHAEHLLWCEPQRKNSTHARDCNAAGDEEGRGPMEAVPEETVCQNSYRSVIQTQVGQFLKPVFFSLYHFASRGVNLIWLNNYLLSIC